MQPKNPSQESVNSETDTFPLPVEQSEAASSSPEQAPSGQPSQPESAEAAPNRAERQLSDPEQSSKGSSPRLPRPDGDAPQQQPTGSPVQSSVGSDSDDNTPLIADDVDVIEKEWVDKAKQIIEQTRNHPYRQEQEVERLQQSYLKKRYGKDVSSANQP